jgi:hypothetical protein
MAIDVYGVNATLASNTTPALKVKSKDRHGRVRVSYDEYEASGTVAPCQICLGWVPAGARLLGIRLQYDALGNGSTLSVGDQFDCDRFLTAVGSGSANMVGGCGTSLVIGAVNLTSTLGLHGTRMGYEFPCDTDILVTSNNVSLTGTIKLFVTYSTD